MKFFNLAFGILLALAGLWPTRALLAAPADCSATLQSLIDGAPSSALYLPACTYTESVTINKDLAIIGATSGGSTILQAPAHSRIITLTGNHALNLQNLTLTGGNPNDGEAGGAIQASSGSLNIADSHLYNNQAASGGAIYQGNAAGNLFLSYDTIENNQTTQTDGGAVFAFGNIISTSTNFNNNSAARYGGALSNYSGNTTINGGNFTGNSSGLNGGAVNVNDGLSVSNTNFVNNTSGDSGGAITQWNAPYNNSITHSYFHGNKAKNKGGGVFINSVVTFDQDWFDANTVDTATSGVYPYGGGVYAGNSGGDYQTPAVTVLNSKFTLNKAVYDTALASFGGGLYIENPSHDGSSVTLAVISNTTFDNNIAWVGAGLLANYGQVNMDNSTISNNQGGYGVGIDAWTLHGQGLLFTGNQADVIGGGIRAGTVALKNSRFIQNTAGYNGGSAMSVSQNLSLTNILLAGNTDTHYGTIQTELSASGTITNVTIVQPTLAASTAIYLVATSSVTISNSIIANYSKCYDIAGTLTEDHMLYSNDTQQEVVESGGTFHNNGYNLAFDAQFVSPAASDYHLKSTSPAIAGGAYTAGIDVDLDYRGRRPNHSAMGAYNYWRAVEFVPFLRK